MSETTEPTEEESTNLIPAIVCVAAIVTVPYFGTKILTLHRAKPIKERLLDKLFGPIENYDYTTMKKI